MNVCDFLNAFDLIGWGSEFGWPVVLSDWMAHKDVESESLVHIDPSLILKIKKNPKKYCPVLYDILIKRNKIQRLRKKNKKLVIPKTMNQKTFENCLEKYSDLFAAHRLA